MATDPPPRPGLMHVLPELADLARDGAVVLTLAEYGLLIEYAIEDQARLIAALRHAGMIDRRDEHGQPLPDDEGPSGELDHRGDAIPWRAEVVR